MTVLRSLTRFLPSWRKLHKAVTICLLVSLLAGLIPPPLVRSMAESALPASLADPVAELAETLLPAPQIAQAAAYSYEQTPNQAISDNSCPTGVTTTIAVADDFTINDLNVGLTIDHTYRNDLDVTLTSPAGTSVILFTDIGLNGTQNFDLLLDDAAATDIGSLTSGNHNTASPYYENLFNPEGAVVLSAFDGENAQGNWTLRVCDDAGGDTGTIRRVALQFDGTPTVIAIPGHIIGYVFQDYDGDGTKDSGPVVDGGVANVTVTAYDAAGATFSAVTDSTGAYDIDANAGTGPFRVEFTNLPSGYYPAYHNSNSGSNSAAPNSTTTTAGTTVQFVPTAGVSNVNLGINRPLDYTAGAVGFAVSVMRASAASGQTNLATRYGYISLPYNATGDATGVGDKNNPDFTKDVAFADIGTTWGAAYQRRSGLLFAGAVMKRHQGLGPLVEPTVGAGVQNVPVDGIYMINYGGSVGGTKVGGFTLNGVTPAAGDLGAIDTGTVQRETINTTVTTAKPYALSTTSEDSFDVDAFNKAGKIGFGDVEISEDGQSLWIVNLNQKSLIRIDVSNFSGLPTSGAIDGALLAHYAIDFGELPACTGEYRPWGLNFHAGSGYIGVVCDGSSGTHGDLHAHVLEFDPVTVTGFTSVVDINLAPSTYVRESAQYETAFATCTLGTQQGWNRWANSWADLGVSGNTNSVFGGEAACPQPILSGIAFADNGDMILGLMDRSTLQLDRANWAANTAQGTTTFYSIDGGGDTLHVCATAGGYMVEGFAGCVIDNDTKTTGDAPTTRLSAADGPNGQGEFYYGDYSSVYDTAGSARHVENNLGAVLTVPGSDQVLVTGYDVLLGDFNQGFHWYQTRTGANPGARVSQYQISVEGANDINTKGMNLGDIELLSPAAPIEIGNRIWSDADGDGIQDPSEAPISGVIVELYKNGVKIGVATSDATGEYYFTSGTNATDSNTNDNIIHDGGIGILPGTGAAGGDSLYELRIPNITGGSKQAALGSNNLTTANAGSNDSIDSDGTVSGVDAIYAIPYADLADSGYNNHTYDFGFGAVVTNGTIQIVKNSTGGDTTFDFSSADTDLAAVGLTTSSGTAASAVITKSVGTYTITEDTLAGWTLDSIAISGTDGATTSTTDLANRRAVINLDANDAITVTFTNSALPIVADPGGFTISKAIATTDGSSPSVSGAFDVVVSCPGVSGYPATLSVNADGTPINASNLVSGTVCSFSENTLTLPSAPSGYTWVKAQIDPSSITIQSNITATVTATNWLAPLPTAPTTVLTVTKTISGTGSGPFDITITGPSGYLTTTQIDDGDVLTFTNLTSGVYTVTESTPAGWMTVYTATTLAGSVSGSSQAVVTLENANSATLTATPISGKVFRDFNSNGQITANGTITDTGVPSVTVTAYDKSGNSVGSATTDANGDYTINPTGDGPYRVEFSNLPAGYEPTTHAAQNSSSVQFVNSSPASGVNLGINRPCDYCAQTTPQAVSTLFFNGYGSSTNVMSSFSYTASGAAPTLQALGTQAQLGSTWGLAYNRSKRKLYSAAILRRHVGLGPNGLGAIYVKDMANPATPPALWLDLAALGIPVGSIGTNSDRGLPNTAVVGAGVPSNDPTAFPLIAKIGLGDIDIADDDRTLYVMNLADKTLYAFDTTTKAQVAAFAIPAPNPICTGGEHRPFAVKVAAGVVYVGLVCDAFTSQLRSDLRAIVYRLDGALFSKVIDFSLDYPRQASATSCPDPNPGPFTQWQPYTDTYTFSSASQCGVFGGRPGYVYSTPILADLEFDAAGNMLIGMMDRSALQGGSLNYATTGTATYTVLTHGDLLRATPVTNSNQYQIEDLTTPPTPREFFTGDIFTSGQSHLETTQGGLAVLPGSNQVIGAVMDPVAFTSGGVQWLDTLTGTRIRAAQIYIGRDNGYFGKGASLGDVELICDPAPIEIGNRVWNDLDGDGVQDPGEPGLDNVTVSAIGSDGSSRTVTTDVAGNYYFTATANTVYTLTMNVPAGYSLTTANTDALSGASVGSNHAISDTRDSDAALIGGVATIYYTTGSAGQNNHGLDFGFFQAPSGQVAILNVAPPLAQFGDRVWIERDGDGLAATGVITPVAGLVITAANGSQLYTTMTDAQGYYSFTVPGGSYTVTYGTIPAQYGNVRPSQVVSGNESGNAGSYQEVGNPDTNHSQHMIVTLAAGEANWQVDFAFWLPQPSIMLEKATNGDDADTPTGPTVAAGSVVTWTYVITNTGNVTLTNLLLVDDQEGGILCPQSTLAPSAGMTCVLTGTAQAGQYANTAVVTGTPTLNGFSPVTDSDPSHYLGLTAGLGDRVWYDDNHNGVQDNGEDGVPNVTVELLDGSGNLLQTTQTNATGYYSFTELAPTLYSVRFVTNTLPAGYLITLRDQGGDNAVDSDADPATGRTVNTLLTNSEYDPDWDLGIWLPQPGLALVKATNGVDADTPPGPTVTVGSVVTWTYAMTNTGNVTLTNITLVDDQEGAIACPAITLAPGAAMTCLLTGTAVGGQYANTAVVTGAPTAGVTPLVTATNPSHYTAPVVSIGNLVWEDGNNNGLYDVGEDLIGGLLMELWVDLDNDGLAEPQGDDALQTPLATTTSVSGTYSFTNLIPGNYFVRIPAPPPVTPLSSIPLSSPDNGVDNDDNGDQPDGPNTQILSPVINLAVGEEPGTGGGGNADMTVDFGLVDPMIGNLVWHDQNNNGQVDSGEPGIGGVTVTILHDADNNSVIEGSELTPVRTTATDQNGIYVFPDLAPNSNYQVVIPVSNFMVGAPLAILRSSSDLTDADDNQQDEDDNGIQATSGLTVTSPLINLTVDAEPTDGDSETGLGNTLDNGDDNNGDMTIDFGFYSSADLHLTKVATPPFAVAGDTVTYVLQLTNDGPDPADTVVIHDPLPAGVTYVSHDPAVTATYNTATRTVEWTVPELAVNSSTTLTITVAVE